MQQKPIIINDIVTNYLIDENGQIFNTKTNKYLKGSIKNTGYKMALLSINGKKKDYAVHRLVAEAFIPNPNNKPVVNHKDGNKLNNCVSNLEWTTYSENRTHAVKTGLSSNRGKQERYEFDLPGEIWAEIADTNYLASNLGRIRSIKTNNILNGSITERGYIVCSIRVNGKTLNKQIHDLVYFAFHPETKKKDDYVINHIDGNKSNNKLNNLEYVKNSENIIHGKYRLKNNSVKKCYQYDLNGNLIAEYPSMTKAAKAVMGDVSGISQACSGLIYEYKGFIWKK